MIAYYSTVLSSRLSSHVYFFGQSLQPKVAMLMTWTWVSAGRELSCRLCQARGRSCLRTPAWREPSTGLSCCCAGIVLTAAATALSSTAQCRYVFPPTSRFHQLDGLFVLAHMIAAVDQFQCHWSVEGHDDNGRGRSHQEWQRKWTFKDPMAT